MKRIIDIEKDYYEMLEYDVEHGQEYKPIKIIANSILLDEDICKEFLNKRNMSVIPGETLIALQLACGTPKSQGEWIYDEKLCNWKCSKCFETPKTIGYVGNRDFMNEHFKYCNHCGAKMEVKNVDML